MQRSLNSSATSEAVSGSPAPLGGQLRGWHGGAGEQSPALEGEARIPQRLRGVRGGESGQPRQASGFLPAKQRCTLGDLLEHPLEYSIRTATDIEQKFQSVISKVLFDPKCTRN